MFKIIAAIVAASFAVSALAMPTEAAVNTYRSNGWHVVKSNQKTATVTLKDRTPWRTYVYVNWMKKPGTQKCRARVTFNKDGVNQSRVFEKWTRNRSKSGIWILGRGGRTDKTIKTTITTNGRCIIWAAVQ
jgi:hypothetical protein